MINVFQVADNDQSILYLGQIFGNVGAGLSGTGPTLLANMFKTFNTMLLVVGVIFVVYTTVMGVIATAHEGEFMGKKWNSIWIPLRMIMGIVALVPTKSGYCAIQVVIIWLVVQGVGAADSVWKTTVDYVASGGGLTRGNAANDTDATIQPGPAASLAPSKIQKIFGNLVCQSIMTKMNANSQDVVGRSQVDNAQNPTTYYFGMPGDKSICGSVSWTSSTSGVQEAAGSAMLTLVPALETIANYYVNQVIQDTSCWNNCSDPLDTGPCKELKDRTLKDPLPDTCMLNQTGAVWDKVQSYAGSNFLNDANKMLAGYANNFVINKKMEDAKKSGSQINAGLSDVYKKAQANGWIFAGAFYYYIANKSNAELGDMTAFYQAINVENITSIDSGELQKYQVINFYCGSPKVEKVGDTETRTCKSAEQAGGALGLVNSAMQAMRSAQSTGGGIEVQSGGGGPLGELTSVSNTTIETWIHNISGDEDTAKNPIVNVQYFGKSMLIAAEVLFWLGLAIVIGLGVLSTYLVVLGTTVNPVAGVATAILSYVIPVITALVVYMITIGGLLGIYVPLIPYILFTIGSIGWFIAVIEAMVAGPLIALGMLSPGGQHEILGRAEHSAMIILNVLLRPTFMIFGMMAAMLLSYVVMKIINGAFLGVVQSVSSGRGMGLLEAFLFIMAYAGLVISALNKCFSLIHILPDKVLRFIGGQAESYGGAEEAEAVKGKVAAGGEAGGRAASGAGSAGGAASGAISASKSKGELGSEAKGKELGVQKANIQSGGTSAAPKPKDEG
jgi:defect-in-organelle-trafficking protein DotA